MRHLLNDVLVLVSVMILLSAHSLKSEGPIKVSMVKMQDPRSIGSCTTVVSKISYDGTTSGSVGFTLYAETITAGSVKRTEIAENAFIWEHPESDQQYILTSFPYLNLSTNAGPDLNREIIWEFSYLPEDYNKLVLSTHAYEDDVNPGVQANTTLNVLPCESPYTAPTTSQASYFNITSSKINPGFNDKGNCTCLEQNQKLFYVNGSQVNETALCGANASWIGCKNVQCWSGPTDVEAMQASRAVEAANPFNCSFNEGFPTKTEIAYWVNNITIKSGYILKSSDNGKHLTCSASSQYTSVMSRQITIVVYYSPENARLSDNSPIIEINSMKNVTYSFSVNPENGSIDLSIENQSRQEPPGVFSWGHNYSQNSQYFYDLCINVSSEADYQSYNICASTEHPPGKDCTKLTIRNILSEDTPQSTIAAFSVTTGPKKPTEEGTLYLIIGLTVAVCVIVAIVVVLAIVMFRRRKKGGNQEAEREERLNELYEMAPNRASSSRTNPESVRQEQANVLYGSASDVRANAKAQDSDDQNAGVIADSTGKSEAPQTSDVVYAAVDAAEIRKDEEVEEEKVEASEQPGPSNMPDLPVYSQVDLSHRRTGDQNAGFIADSPVKSKGPQTPTVVCAAVDTTEKRKDEEEASGPVYAHVNKLKQSG